MKNKRISHRLISTLVKCQHTNMSERRFFTSWSMSIEARIKIDIDGGCDAMLYAVYQYPNRYVYIRFAAWMPFTFTIKPTQSCANALIFTIIWFHSIFMNEISCWNGKCRRMRNFTTTLPLSLSHVIFVYQQHHVTWTLSPSPHTSLLLISTENFNVSCTHQIEF